MIIRSTDHTRISFGKLSDDGVLKQSPLAAARPDYNHFTSANFQYIVDNIADMFGYAHGLIRVSVNANDLQPIWVDKNGNDRPEEDEITFRFTMNANINTYLRTSTYGKHFMYQAAAQYGAPIVFGIAAHEIGHLITNNCLNIMTTQIVQGRPALVCTQTVHPYWGELCSDYLSGIVLAKCTPPLNHEPLKQYLSATEAGPNHPSGLWRTYAVEMGYQWGRNNPRQSTDAILCQIDSQRQLLLSFFQSYYQGLYARTNARVRAAHSPIPNQFTQPSNLLLGYL